MSSRLRMKTIFGSEGLLARKLNKFEPRQGQLIMAEAIESLLGVERSDYSLTDIMLIEAETGIGKTLAYLVPAILSNKKIVISTATINLQDQILKKEIPLLEEVFGERISVVCVKGRQNYLCYYRWYQYQSSLQLSFLDDQTNERINEWLASTETGDRAELDWLPDNSPLWPKISAKSHQCLGNDCPEAPLCFVNALRKKAGAARLLVVNHHLFFSDLALRKNGFGEVLPRYEGVIFDEAHHLESTASNFFGKSFSQYQILDLVTDIERQAETDLAPSLADKMINSARGLRERTDQFTNIFPVERGRFPLQHFIEEMGGWHDEIKLLSIGIERIIAELHEFREHGEGWQTLIRRAEELNGNLLEIALPDVVMEDGRYVHWYERRERAVTLSATPINVSENLREILYPSLNFCVMTSATLTSSGNFSYVLERLGVEDAVETLRLRSPFDYANQTCLYIPEKRFPLPTEPGFAVGLNERIHEIIKISRGRALILCTSFKGMDSVAEYLENYLDYPVLVQGKASRHALLSQFQETTESVLVAVASFWEGVDVPGESLSCVIIDKLPFESPSDPVLQARLEDIKVSGGNPFYDFQVPRAILTLRQGVGRLMRSSSDRGLIAVMDGRLYAKRYGRSFLDSLPPSPIVRDLAEVEGFFCDI